MVKIITGLFVKQLDMIEGIIDSENKISIAGPTKSEDSVRRISIDEYINMLHTSCTLYTPFFNSPTFPFISIPDVCSAIL